MYSIVNTEFSISIPSCCVQLLKMETTSDLMIFRFQNDFRFPKLLLDFRKLELIFEKYLFHPLVLTFRMILFLLSI